MLCETVTTGAAMTSLRVTEDGVRLRERPSTNSPILATMAAGTLVEPASDHAWRAVRFNGQDGYIAAEYLEPAPAETGPPAGQHHAFDPTTPTYLQRQDWTCSIGSVIWMLRSIVIAVTPAEAQDAMVPRYVNSAVGLLDASGAGIVRVLADHWSVEAFNHNPVSFDQVAGWAGRMPLAIGLRNWGGPGFGHWSAVRGFDGQRLVLANPGGTGPRFGQQTLTRADFNARGPASAVAIPVG